MQAQLRSSTPVQSIFLITVFVVKNFIFLTVLHIKNACQTYLTSSIPGDIQPGRPIHVYFLDYSFFCEKFHIFNCTSDKEYFLNIAAASIFGLIDRVANTLMAVLSALLPTTQSESTSTEMARGGWKDTVFIERLWKTSSNVSPHVYETVSEAR